LSIPLSEEAKVEASNEIEWRAKGVFIESFLRSGSLVLGAHSFIGDERYLANAVVNTQAGRTWWTAIGGAAKSGESTRGRWSLEGEYIPRSAIGLGARVEDQAADGLDAAILPYINIQWPGTRGTLRLTIERRFQKGRNGTFVEFGTVF
jgi:hypothetical protein